MGLSCNFGCVERVIYFVVDMLLDLLACDVNIAGRELPLSIHFGIIVSESSKVVINNVPQGAIESEQDEPNDLGESDAESIA